MTEIDQAARRAAEKIVGTFSVGHEGDLRFAIRAIVAEFAPLLAEAVGLLERAERYMPWGRLENEIGVFIAKHKEQGNG